MKMRNRILSAVMAVAATLSFACVSAFAAAPSLTLSASATKVQAGDTFTVDITTNDNPGVCVLTLKGTGSNDVFTLTKVDDAKLYSGKTHGNNLGKADYVLAWWIDDTFSEESTDSGKAVTLTYQVKENAAPGKYTISYATGSDTYNSSDEFVDFGTGSVEIEVVGATAPTKEVGLVATLKYDSSKTGVAFTVKDTVAGLTSAPWNVPYAELAGTIENLENITVGLKVTDVPETSVLTATAELY